MKRSSRRDFLKSTVAGVGVLAALSATARGAPPVSTNLRVVGLACPPLPVIRWGFIGIGARGLFHLKETLLMEGCEVRALCDIDGTAVQRGLQAVAEAGRPAPAIYPDGPEAYLKLLERGDLDAVLIATPWRFHLAMATAALRGGKHAFVEVPAALTIDGCWELVEAAEKYRLHCMMLENCCYGRDELMVLNLCRQGLFGELLHGEGGYLHDLRDQLRDFNLSEGMWRPHEHTLRNGNLYPTHGLGPIAQAMGINRGDRFEVLTSFSSMARGLADYTSRLPATNPNHREKFICGDMNVSLIRTARGRTLVVKHDTSNCQAYSRVQIIQGTRGGFAGYPSRISLEGHGDTHEWDLNLAPWYEKFDHPWWTQGQAARARLAPHAAVVHGGMDFVMRWRLVECLRQGQPLDQDVYDAAAWSAIGPLSEASVAGQGAPVEVPDFTRGAWTSTPALGLVS
jgi:predicted dehydrogenase